MDTLNKKPKINHCLMISRQIFCLIQICFNFCNIFFLFLKGPEVSVDKPFLWTEGRVSLHAALDKSAYGHGEHIAVTIDVRNDSRKIIRKVRVRKQKLRM